MTGLFIPAADKSDLKIFIDLAKRIGIKTKQLSEEEMLDLGLFNAMKEGRKSAFVSKESILKKLNA